MAYSLAFALKTSRCENEHQNQGMSVFVWVIADRLALACMRHDGKGKTCLSHTRAAIKS